MHGIELLIELSTKKKIKQKYFPKCQTITFKLEVSYLNQIELKCGLSEEKVKLYTYPFF